MWAKKKVMLIGKAAVKAKKKTGRDARMITSGRARCAVSST